MRLILMIILLALPFQASAQGVATLVADSVTVDGNSTLIADGNIEVLYDGTRLSARRIVYDRNTDRLVIDGPIFVQTADGTVFTAQRASLDPKLENGVLRSARLVLDDQLQLAANQIDRVDGRYSQLQQVVASSCAICANRAPLWDIRAERVIHDEDAQQLYFTNATLRVRGTPILWLPQMRLPDPTLTRATGFLIPRIRTTDQLNTGIKTPYFIRLGDHRDLTLTPYISSQTRTIEARYRQAYISGDIEINAAVSDDTLEDDLRTYAFARGNFALPAGYTLSFNLQTVSDQAYLLDYGYADIDRLESTLRVEKITANTLTSAQLSYFETLRDDEVNADLPPIVARLSYEKRDAFGGGQLRYGTSFDSVIRTGPTGRDLARAGGFANYSRDMISAGGIVTTLTGDLRADWFRVTDDANYESDIFRVVPAVQATFQLPLSKISNTGASHLLTPTLSIAWSDILGDTAPNEDSTRSELDQANLFDLSLFAGDDRVETGLRVAAGLQYARRGAQGSFGALTFGRVIREAQDTAFSPSSGLNGLASDWLIAGQVITPQGISVNARTLFDEDLQITRGAARLGWQTDTVDLNAAYIWNAEDPTEARPEAVSEWTLDTRLQLSDAWAVSVDTRYDIAADQPARAGLGIEWRNECVTVDLSVSRRYTSSTTVNPSTDYGLSVQLNGFSAGRAATGPRAACSN